MRDYLQRVYGVDVIGVRSYVEQQKITRERPMGKWGYGRVRRPESKKRMTVEMTQPFVWPDAPKDTAPYVSYASLSSFTWLFFIIKMDLMCIWGIWLTIPGRKNQMGKGSILQGSQIPKRYPTGEPSRCRYGTEQAGARSLREGGKGNHGGEEDLETDLASFGAQL